MPLFLAGLLVRCGVLSPQLVEEALQRQVLAGGALDSSLLELGASDEPRLAEFLARASALPLVGNEQLAAPDQRLRRLFPLRLAERHGLVPFAQEDRTLRVACTYPSDAALLEEMGFLLSQRIEAYVAPEFRIRLAIERLYGHAASARMHELARRCGVTVTATGATHAPAAPPNADPERVVPPDWTVSDAQARLEAAASRDEAIEVALRFCRRSFSWVALFGLVGGKAVGWDAIGEEPGAERQVEQIAQPLDEETVLATVVRTQGRYLGPLAESEGNRRLLERMGREVPQTAFVHPVEVGNRTVALVWADNGAAAVAPVAAAEAMVVVQALGNALERLIRGRKAAVELHTDEAATLLETASVEAAPADEPAPAATEHEHERGHESEPAAEIEAEETELEVEASPPEAAAIAELELDPEVVAAEERAAPPAAATAPGPRRPVSPGPLEQACRGADSLLAAVTDSERAEALARIAGSGSVGAELLVALLPGPLRTDSSGAICGGVVLDALAALGPWAVPALARAAGSPSSTVRYWVAVLLAGTDDPLAHAALARLALDSDPHVAGLARVAVQPEA